MQKQLFSIAGLDSAQTKQVILRLAHFNPTTRDEYGNQVIDYLVLDSLANYGQLVLTGTEIREDIKSRFLLDFEEPEINASGQRLQSRNLIEYNPGARSDKPTFQILSEIEQKIANNLSQVQNLEDSVIQDWHTELGNTYAEYQIIRDKIDQITDNLLLFTSRMFIRHGIECVALLYPDKQKTHQWLESIEGSILEGLPRIDSFTDAIVRLEIPKFFKNADAKRRDYVTSLFNSSFFWHLVQVDESCSRLLQETTKGQKLYLDNNILYSLVGLHGC